MDPNTTNSSDLAKNKNPTIIWMILDLQDPVTVKGQT